MYTIGQQLKLLIDEKINDGSITLRKLSRGICSKSNLSKMISGSCVAEPRFLKILMQRLGKSPNKLECIVSKPFLDIVRLQNDFDDSIDKRNREQSIKYMEELDCIQDYTDYTNVKLMFRWRNKAAYEFYINNNPSLALEYIGEAIDLTIPGLVSQHINAYALSSVEIENLLFAILMQIRLIDMSEHRWKLFDIRTRLNEIIQFITDNISDTEELAAIMPKAKWISALLNIQIGNYEIAVRECDEGIEYLRNCGLLQMLIPLLGIIKEFGCNYELSDQYNNYLDYLKTLENLNSSYMHSEIRFDSLFCDVDRAIYHYESEIYRGQRQILGFTQETTAEFADTSPDAISRYEKGQRSPRKAQYSRLMETLDIDYAKQGTFFICEDFKVLEAEREFNTLLLRGDYDFASIKLQELCKRTGEKYNSNNAMLTMYKNQIELCVAQNNPKSVLEKDLLLLDKIYPCIKNQIKRPPFLAESGIIAQICLCYRMLGQEEEAYELCNLIVKIFSGSYVDKRMMQRTYGLHLTNLSQMSGDVAISEEAIVYKLLCRSASGLERILSSHATKIYESDKAQSKNIASMAWSVAKLLKNGNADRIARFIEDYFID